MATRNLEVEGAYALVKEAVKMGMEQLFLGPHSQHAAESRLVSSHMIVPERSEHVEQNPLLLENENIAGRRST